MLDLDGHTLIDGEPLHEDDGVFSKPYPVAESDGLHWYEVCHCRICGVQISRPIQGHEIRAVGSEAPG